MVATRDLKFLGRKRPCGFESHLGHSEQSELSESKQTALLAWGTRKEFRYELASRNSPDYVIDEPHLGH